MGKTTTWARSRPGATVLMVLAGFGSVLLAAMPWGPPAEQDEAAAASLVWMYARVAWGIVPLMMASAFAFVAGARIAGARGVPPVDAGLAILAGYPLLLIADIVRDPTGHNLLPFEVLFHAPLLLVGIAAGIGAKCGPGVFSEGSPPDDPDEEADESTDG